MKKLADISAQQHTAQEKHDSDKEAKQTILAVEKLDESAFVVPTGAVWQKTVPEVWCKLRREAGILPFTSKDRPRFDSKKFPTPRHFVDAAFSTVCHPNTACVSETAAHFVQFLKSPAPDSSEARSLLSAHTTADIEAWFRKTGAFFKRAPSRRRYAACQQQSLSRLRPAAAANLSSPLPSTRRQPSTSSTASRPSEHVNRVHREELSGAVAGHRFTSSGTTSIDIVVGGAIVHVNDCYVVDDLRQQLIVGGVRCSSMTR
jgi:hypothetical protein